MAGYTAAQKGHTGLAEFDLGTGELRRIVPFDGDGREGALGDLTVGPDGTVYATDSKASIVWKLEPGAEEPQKVADSPAFLSLQGIVLKGRTLIVADYANGLFAIDPARGTVTALAAPAGTTLLGLDGLAGIPGGLIATQNGVTPQRVLRIALSDGLDAVTAVTVLASGLPHLDDLTLLTLVNDQPTVIAGAGWEGFDPQRTPQPPAHVVRLFQVAIP
jgi:sugar lactone lactonase YvrE